MLRIAAFALVSFHALAAQASSLPPPWAGAMTRGIPMPLMHINAPAASAPAVSITATVIAKPAPGVRQAPSYAPQRYRPSRHTRQPERGFWIYHIVHRRVHWRWVR